jgi:hypothetical protein
MSNIQRGAHIEVGGQKLVLYTKPSATLRDIPGTDLQIDLGNVTMGELAKAANLVGSYDYALPQDFFDGFLQRHGERPYGVWWYPPKEDKVDGKYWLGGRFVSTQEMLQRIGKQIVELEEQVKAGK